MLTDMSQPLGVEVGNANEIEESLAVLRGEGPADVTELVVAFGAEMLVLAGIVDDVAPGRAAIEDGIASGSGLERMAALIAAQGGDPQVIEDTGLLPRADATHELTASRSGFVAACDALAVGIASVRLGAGRTSKEDTIDPGVGISILAKRGDRVDAGQPLARVRYRDPARLQAALRLLEGAWQIGDEPPTGQPLIIEVVR
jgi:pyrimidine-nucleoside phosphorylase